MPTYMGTLCTYTFDLGQAGKRGIAKKFSELKTDIKKTLGRGVPGIRKEKTLDKIVARFEIVLTDHPLTLERDFRAFRAEKYGQKIKQLDKLASYLEKSESKIIYYT